MSLVSEIKCARCDRKYSGVRSRCPYCGARRIGRGKYTEDADNTKGKMLISILIMSVLVVASGVLLFSNTDEVGALPPPAAEDPATVLPDPEANVTSEHGTNLPIPVLPDEPDEPDVPDEPDGPSVSSVRVMFGNGGLSADVTVRVNEVLNLSVRVEPVGVQEEAFWLSSNTGVFEIVPTNPEGTQARLTGIAHGDERLIVTVGGVETEHIIRVRR